VAISTPDLEEFWDDPSSMPGTIENVGSTARDFCMLERNVLSHLKLALLLSLLSSSVLLKARLPDPQEGSSQNSSKSGVLMATLQMVASLAAIGGAYYEYTSNMRIMRNMRAFLVATNPHFALVGVVAGVVFTTSIILLADENEL